MPANKKKISFVIPAFNEEKNIPQLVKELIVFMKDHQRYLFETIVVENGSTDSTYKLLSRYAQTDRRIKILQLTRNFKCDGGIAAGLQYATGDACVIVMADLQEPLAVVNRFIAKWESGYDIVYGVIKKRTAGFFINTCSVLFYKIVNLLIDNKIPEHASDFRLIDKKVCQVINSMTEQNKFLRGIIVWTGFKHTGVSFDRKERHAGRSKAGFSSLFRYAFDAILSFSYLPLRLISFLGVLIVFASALFIVISLSMNFFYGRKITTTASIISTVFFLCGILLSALGIIGEYMARIYEEVKRRPNFIVKDKINLD